MHLDIRYILSPERNGVVTGIELEYCRICKIAQTIKGARDILLELVR